MVASFSRFITLDQGLHEFVMVLAMLKTLLTFILGPIIPINCWATNSI
jgi:hypothetical protein